MNHLLEVRDIIKNYGDYRALNKVNIAIPEQSIFGLLGPNGAGKTSLIRIINQITLPDSGEVYLGGELLQPEHIAQIGYLPEERGLYKNMKVGEQALYLAQLKGMSKREAKIKLKHWFDKFGIGEWWHKKVQDLSKGMAQKVQFIVTVLHQPKLLIFDEPFSGFDPINANLIKEEILQLREEGATVIFSTHRMESVEELCEHIALIDKSNKIIDGNLSDIKKSFRTNTFDVSLENDNISSVKTKIQETFEKELVHLSIQHRQANFTLQAKEQDANALLKALLPLGTICKFNEVIPSVNDIFIQAVAKNNPS